jgi:hypothetical protein
MMLDAYIMMTLESLMALSYCELHNMQFKDFQNSLDGLTYAASLDIISIVKCDVYR